MRSRRIALALLLGWLLAVVSALAFRAKADDVVPGDLDSLVAPIALYPDALIAHILPASTYPVQIVEAARAQHQSGKVDESESSQWDSSVQALLGFPSVLAMMDDRIAWTTQLGQAVADNQGDVLAAIQRVRAEAKQAGNLQSNDKQTVAMQGDNITIAPANPQVMYVPQYDPVAILYPPPPWGYYPVAYGVVGWGPPYPYWPLDYYGVGWGPWPAFFGGSVIVVDDDHDHHGHDHDHDHDHGHDGHWDHGHWSGGGHPWQAPSHQNVGHLAPSPGGFHGSPGGHPGTSIGGLGSRPGAPAHVPAGAAFDQVGGGGWNARSFSARGAHSFGDGFGGGGIAHSGGMSGAGHAGGGGGRR